MTTDRFKDFLAEPRQRPSELESARMRRVLSGLPKSGPSRAADYSDALFTELRAMRGEVSSLRELVETRMQGRGVQLDDEVLTRSQVAKLLRVCGESVSKLVREEGLPCRRVGKEYRFLRSEVVAWLAARASELGDV